MIEYKCTEMDDNKLIYRRQFVLSPVKCTSFYDWQYTRIGHYNLYVHPDVQLTTIESADKNISISLVGYIIDTQSPDKQDIDILRDIQNDAHSIQKLVIDVTYLSGKFVLFVKNACDTYIFHDPCGLRRVCYAFDGPHHFVGSQPYIFQHFMELKQSDVSSLYFSSAYVRKNIEHWLPSKLSLYENTCHLMPNHYLTLSTLQQERFWPTKKLPQNAVLKVVREASDLLVRQIAAAKNRQQLALSLTSGWDSRVLLAASKNISPEIYYYTLQYRDLNPRSPDIKIPQKILGALNIHHHLIPCTKDAPLRFQSIYENNTPLAHFKDLGEIAFNLYQGFPQDRLAVHGCCSEIARCVYYKSGTHPPVTSAEQIGGLISGWRELPFIHHQIDQWFASAKDVAEETGIDILDLFYWEQRLGSWLAQGQLEWSIAQEGFAPFGHRRIQEFLLSVPTNMRSRPDFTLYKLLAQYMWADVLSQPVNPQTIKKKTLQMIKKTRAYHIAKRMYKSKWCAYSAQI